MLMCNRDIKIEYNHSKKDVATNWSVYPTHKIMGQACMSVYSKLPLSIEHLGGGSFDRLLALDAIFCFYTNVFCNVVLHVARL